MWKILNVDSNIPCDAEVGIELNQQDEGGGDDMLAPSSTGCESKKRQRPHRAKKVNNIG